MLNHGRLRRVHTRTGGRQIVEIVGFNQALREINEFAHVTRAWNDSALLPLVPCPAGYADACRSFCLGQPIYSAPVSELSPYGECRHVNGVTCGVTLDNDL